MQFANRFSITGGKDAGKPEFFSISDHFLYEQDQWFTLRHPSPVIPVFFVSPVQDES